MANQQSVVSGQRSAQRARKQRSLATASAVCVLSLTAPSLAAPQTDPSAPASPAADSAKPAAPATDATAAPPPSDSTPPAAPSTDGTTPPATGSEGLNEAEKAKPVDADFGVDDAKKLRKPWEVSAGYEYHRLWRRNDLNGAAANADVNVYALSAQYDITKYDRVRAREFFYQRFLADDGETGLRSDDVILQYTRTIPLPEEIDLKPGAWFTLPTSFASKKASIITVPRVYVSATKTFFKFLTVEPRASGDWYFVNYRTYENGATPNTKARLGMALNIEANVPQHKPLTFGVDFGTAYYWYYDAYGTEAEAGGINPNYPGLKGYPSADPQPIQQTYGGEIYAKYDLPEWKHFRTEILAAFANGDPTIGYTSAIHDGARYFYFGHRATAEVYAGLTVRY